MIKLVVVLIAAAMPSLGASVEKIGHGTCDPGPYASVQGEKAALTIGAQKETRYTFQQGARGSLDDEDASLQCRDGILLGADGSTWRPVEMRITRTSFEVDGDTLVGELIEPVGVQSPPLVALAHGSEDFGWLGGAVPQPYLLVAEGISVFIFDKRGTGLSEGGFSMNFQRLARDLAAASTEAMRLAEGRYSEFGLVGFSQGGWVAPLAALDVQPDFLVVNYGLVLSPQEEDAEEVKDELRRLGYGPDVLARAREVTDATGAIMIEGVEAGIGRLDQARRAHGDQPWFHRIQGEFSGRLLAMDRQALLEAGGRLNRHDVDYGHDAIAILRSMSVPLLWIAAGDDRVAPPRLTLQRLGRLREEGVPVELAVFPDADHGVVEFEEQADGTRIYGGYAAGYFPLLSDWINGCLIGKYGRADLASVTSRRPDCVRRVTAPQ